MPNNVKPVPEGYHTVTPYLIVRDAAAAIDFYKKAFNATERMRLEGPEGKIGHAEIVVEGSRVMMADEHPDMDVLGPQSRGGTTVSLLIYVEDVDARYDQAIEAGGKEIRPLTDQFYGDRSGTIEDPFGHSWSIATHIEDVTDEEVERRYGEMMSGGGEIEIALEQ